MRYTEMAMRHGMNCYRSPPIYGRPDNLRKCGREYIARSVFVIQKRPCRSLPVVANVVWRVCFAYCDNMKITYLYIMILVYLYNMVIVYFDIINFIFYTITIISYYNIAIIQFYTFTLLVFYSFHVL